MNRTSTAQVEADLQNAQKNYEATVSLLETYGAKEGKERLVASLILQRDRWAAAVASLTREKEALCQR